jgi:hypothetical protein
MLIKFHTDYSILFLVFCLLLYNKSITYIRNLNQSRRIVYYTKNYKCTTMDCLEHSNYVFTDMKYSKLNMLTTKACFYNTFFNLGFYDFNKVLI